MSSFDVETAQAQEKGPESFLSPEERKTLQRMLAFPEEFPSELWSAMADKLAVDGLQIPFSQIVGAIQYRPDISTGAFSGATWTTYQSVGAPSLTVGPGRYLLQYGWGVVQNASSNIGTLKMAPSINGATPSDADAVDTVTVLNNTSLATAIASVAFKSFFRIATLTEQNNTIELQTKVSNGDWFADRAWLFAIKIGN